METTADHPVTERQKQVRWRIFWFLAGAVINYVLISTPLHWLKNHTNLPEWLRVGCSVGMSTWLLFLWNYSVNFRTDLRKRDALPRYLAAVVVMWILSSTTLWLLKQYNAHYFLSIFGQPLDLDIIATQGLLAGLKFPLYHKWAFPLPKE